MRYFLLFIFIIINAFLYVLNFELFNSVVNMDFGFDIITTMPILLILIVSLIFILIYVMIGNNNEKSKNTIIDQLESKIKLLEKDLEINDLKNQVELKAIPEESPIIIE